MSRNGVWRSSRRRRSRSSQLVSRTLLTIWMPALFTRTSMGPFAFSAPSSHANATSGLPRSACTTCVRSGASFASLSRRSRRRAMSVTLAPRFRYSRAMASPIPLEAPVTTTCWDMTRRRMAPRRRWRAPVRPLAREAVSRSTCLAQELEPRSSARASRYVARASFAESLRASATGSAAAGRIPLDAPTP